MDVEPDGTLDVLFGTTRAQVAGERVTWAQDVMPSPIEEAVRMSDGWVFRAAFLGEAVLASSPQFIGTLTGFVQTHRDGSLDLETGLAAVVDQGELFLGERVGAIRHAGPVPVFPLWGLAFVDALHGALLSDAARVFVTEDGGTHWRQIDTHDTVVERLQHSPHGIRGVIAGGSIEVLAATASPEPHRPAPDPATRARLPEVLLRDAALHHRAWIPSLFAAGFVHPFASGETLVADTHTALLVARDGGSFVPIDGLRTDCRWSDWGRDAVMAVCAGDVMRIDSRGRSTIVLRGAQSARAADDGDHLWLPDARCPAAGERAPRPSPQTLCRWSVAEQRGIEAPFDLNLRFVAGHVLQWEQLGCTEPGLTDVRHLDLNAVPPRWPRVQLPSPVTRFDHFEHDGSGAFSGAGADSRRDPARYFAIRGSPERPVAVPLPPEAESAAFADAMRGAASDPASTRVWVTDDAGRTWHAVAVPPALASGRQMRGFGPEITCDPTGCTLGRVFRITDFSGAPLVLDASTVIATRDPLSDHGARRDAFQIPRPVCRRDASAHASIDAAAEDVAPVRGSVRVGHVGSAIVVTWNGHDAAGDYRERAGPPRGAVRWLADDPRSHRPAITAGFVRRDVAAVEVCEQACALYIARPSRPVVPLLVPGSGTDAAPIGPVISLPGGAIAMTANVAGTERALRVEPDGTVTSTRPLPTHGPGPFVALVTQANRVGIGFVDRADQRHLEITWAGEDRSNDLSVSLPEQPLSPCGADRGALRAYVVEPRWSDDPSWVARVALGEHGACVEALWDRDMAGNERVLEAHGADGYVGTELGAGPRRLRCSLGTMGAASASLPIRVRSP